MRLLPPEASSWLQTSAGPSGRGDGRASVRSRAASGCRHGERTAAAGQLRRVYRSSVLSRDNALRQGQGDWVSEVVSPRVFRLNLRLAFL